MSKVKPGRLRVSFAFAKSDAAILSRGRAVVNGMRGNPAYSNSPVDPATLETALDKFAVAMGEAADRGRKAIAERNRLRDVVLDMLRTLGHYVESTCNQDLPTLLSSGFEGGAQVRTAPHPLEPPTIKMIVQGVTGQLLVKVKSVSKARSYELRFASMDANGAAGPWTSLPITTVTNPTSCAGLVPGSTYAFQVRALGRLGFTDWSHPVAKMCT